MEQTSVPEQKPSKVPENFCWGQLSEKDGTLRFGCNPCALNQLRLLQSHKSLRHTLGCFFPLPRCRRRRVDLEGIPFFAPGLFRRFAHIISGLKTSHTAFLGQLIMAGLWKAEPTINGHGRSDVVHDEQLLPFLYRRWQSNKVGQDRCIFAKTREPDEPILSPEDGVGMAKL